MGKTVPTYKKLLEEEIKRWKEFREALRKEEREIFDRLMESCEKYSSAGRQAKRPDPFETMVISLLLDQRKDIDSLREELDRVREDLEEE